MKADHRFLIPFLFATVYGGYSSPYDLKSELLSTILREKLMVTKYPPCCGDLIGGTACKRLQKNNPQNFERRCDSDADFSLMQCCRSCGLDTAPDRYSKFFREGDKSRACFDRRGQEFCKKFMTRGDVWSPSKWSCSGENGHLAFRICRRTCQYCDPNLYRAPEGGRYKPTACGSPPAIEKDIITRDDPWTQPSYDFV